MMCGSIDRTAAAAFGRSACPCTNIGHTHPSKPTNPPKNTGSETALFVLVPNHADHKFLPSFTWGEPQTGMTPWSARPDLHVVFVPVADSGAAQRVFSE